ncbi:NAD-dependent succinate-semialdehyde dehydrogenase [Chitinophaga sp. 30R24]|uniref:NAD-dependent succinate-semialdehyde dehydrogenase n=1 Tax=Chitinophaga sp. 30R24 TaxID=3248838 RepID=UPI003B900C8F
MFTSINPFTQETIAVYTAHTQQEIAHKLELGYNAYRELGKVSLEQRRQWIMQVAQSLKDNVELHASLITQEMGKTLKEARAEVLKCATSAEYYAENITDMLQPRIIRSDAYKSYVSYEPKGIILAIMPWNFPYWQVFRFALPNILAGNTGLLKHASNVSGCALAIEKIFTESPFPAGTFQSLLVTPKELEPIMADPRVQGVTITGSTPAGKNVAALAGKYIKKTVLELGGSDPFIVLKDADVEAAAKTAVIGRMQNAGQSCIAAKRWIVEKEIVPTFTTAVRNILLGLKQGDPTLEETTMGPMARLDLAEELNKQLQSSIQQGARLELGGIHEGCNFAPTLLTGVTSDMTAFKEETFGPLAVIVEAQNEDDAIALANETPFGLGAALWTSDLDKAALLATKIESGNVFINAMVRSDARLPFGGVKESGYGRELSLEGTHEFLNIKTVYIQP